MGGVAVVRKGVKLQLKELSDGGVFTGYASVFGVVDADGDVMAKGAFGAVEPARIKMLWQHDPTAVIGTWAAIDEDDTGLLVKGELILEVDRAREAYALLRAGAIDEMSVGFQPQQATKSSDNSGRVFTSVKLWEISLVTWAANPAAKVTDVKTIRDFEIYLRDAGWSRKQATAIASRGFRAIEQGDPGEDEAIMQLAKLIQIFRGVPHE
jgi:uncharacterized protein